MPRTAKSRAVSDDSIPTLVESRAQARAVKLYLTALESSRTRRGRGRTPDTIEARLAAIADALPDADPFKQLGLIQERLNLEAESAALSVPAVDLAALEEDFVRSAGSYAERKGLSYAAFREVGIAPSVLRRAGITRAS